MLIDEYHQLCTDWLNGEQPREKFPEVLSLGLDVLGIIQTDLAGEFEVAGSTISRWARGTARPHPHLQKQIVESLHRRSYDAWTSSANDS